MNDEYWMRRALALAELAAKAGEVPVGAVLVKDGREIAAGWNRPIGDNDPTAHAEVVALRASATVLENYRLPGTWLYVTLEPCAMCAGAIIQARLAGVVFGATDPRAGAAGSVFDVLGSDVLNHRLICKGNVLAEEARSMLRAFFAARRHFQANR
ncbi:MAG: tRNA adenosine(34) deaminase TadA [Gammaproteobacteria bacterium]|nr:tRNA adenosine(34) deaminase TadA [Gammaproteobacteria bacterium]